MFEWNKTELYISALLGGHHRFCLYAQGDYLIETLSGAVFDYSTHVVVRQLYTWITPVGAIVMGAEL